MRKELFLLFFMNFTFSNEEPFNVVISSLLVPEYIVKAWRKSDNEYGAYQRNERTGIVVSYQGTRAKNIYNSILNS